MPNRTLAPFRTVEPLNSRFRTCRSARRRASARVMKCFLPRRGFSRLADLPAAFFNFLRALLMLLPKSSLQFAPASVPVAQVAELRHGFILTVFGFVAHLIFHVAARN